MGNRTDKTEGSIWGSTNNKQPIKHSPSHQTWNSVLPRDTKAVDSICKRDYKSRLIGDISLSLSSSDTRGSVGHTPSLDPGSAFQFPCSMGILTYWTLNRDAPYKPKTSCMPWVMPIQTYRTGRRDLAIQSVKLTRSFFSHWDWNSPLPPITKILGQL